MPMKKMTVGCRIGSFLRPLIVMGGLLCFLTAVYNLDRGQSAEELCQLEESLRRAAVAYYAAEGVYPPTLEELIRYGGIRIDRDRYCVFYEVFADNLMPDITVLGMKS